MWLCASFMLLAPAARQVSSAVPISTSGSSTSSSLPIAMNLTSSELPTPRPMLALNLNDSRISRIAVNPTRVDASILPLTRAPRGAGVASSGSSDCRSRSPAVVSMTRCEPPMKADIISRIGRMTDSRMPRLASAVARSRVPTLTGMATAGLTPRAISRSAPTCWP